jgi:hypothetical protein
MSTSEKQIAYIESLRAGVTYGREQGVEITRVERLHEIADQADSLDRYTTGWVMDPARPWRQRRDVLDREDRVAFKAAVAELRAEAVAAARAEILWACDADPAQMTSAEASKAIDILKSNQIW